MEGGSAPVLVVEGGEEGVEVEVIVDDLSDDPGEVIGGEPLVEIGRKEQSLIGIVSAEGGTVRARHERP